MTTKPMDHALPIANLTLALVLGVISATAFAGPGTQTEDDIYVGRKRQAQGATVPAAMPATTTRALLPGAGTAPGSVPGTTRSAAPPPGVGTRTPVQGVTTPGTAAPQPRAGAGVSPNTGAVAAKTNARTGGDGDLDELEVERRKVQGVTTPGTSTPQIRPGAGTSPNTGRSAAPALLPGKP